MSKTKATPKITTMRVSEKWRDAVKREAMKEGVNLYPFVDKVLAAGLKAGRATK